MYDGSKATETLATIDPLLHFIEEAYSYKFTQGPDVVHSKQDALRDGINCVSLAHLALRDLFDIKLPSSLMCAEMYLDQQYFATVDSVQSSRRGDLYWFGIEDPHIQPDEFSFEYQDGELINWADFPVKHVAIHTGNALGSHNPLLLHSTFRVNNVIWPLEKFSNYIRYSKLYGITRLMQSTVILDER